MPGNTKWTEQEVRRIAEYIPKYRELIVKQKYTAIAAQEVIIKELRNENPDFTVQRRTDGALGARIDYLDKVMAGEKNINDIPGYDEEYHDMLPR